MPEKTKRAPAELLDAIRKLDADDELETTAAMSDDDLAADVAKAGGDPKGIGARAAAFAAQQAERAARLAWQEKARERIERAWAAAEHAPKTPALPRAELLARIEAARKSPRFAAPLAAAFRKRTAEQATDEELRALLDEIALLEAMGDEGGGGD